MSHLIEYRKINGKNLVFMFKFRQLDTKIGETIHNVTLDKWLTIDDWTNIFNRLETFVQEYLTNNERITTNQNITLNSNLSIMTSWVPMNNNIAHLCGISGLTAYKNYLKVKVNCLPTFSDHVKRLEHELVQLKNSIKNDVPVEKSLNSIDKLTLSSSPITSKPSSSPSISMGKKLNKESSTFSIENNKVDSFDSNKSDVICISSVTNSSTGKSSKETKIYVDEEYIPSLPKDSSTVNLIPYIPSKKDETDTVSMEYTPTNTSLNNDDSLTTPGSDETSIYCPGGTKHFHHEPYNPTNVLNNSMDDHSSPAYESKQEYRTPSPSQSPDKYDKIAKENSSPLSIDPLSFCSADYGTENDKTGTPKRAVKHKSTKTKRKETGTNCGSSEDLFGDSDSDSDLIFELRKKLKKDNIPATKTTPSTPTATPRQHLMRKSKSQKQSIDEKNPITNWFSPQSSTSGSSSNNNNLPSSSSVSTSSSHLNKKTSDKEKKTFNHEWLSKEKILSQKRDKEANKKVKSNTDKEKKPKTKRPKKIHMTEEELNKFSEDHKRKMAEIDSRRIVLDKPKPSKPVELKTLEHVRYYDFINSYSTHKEMMHDFVRQYYNRKTPKLPPTFHLDTFIVLNVASGPLQLKLIQFLEEKFSQNNSISALTELFWDTVLPEWILRYYMEEYDFTRQEALKQISDQQNTLASQNDSLLST